MKYYLFFIPILFISNCCLVTSQDCGCEPPDPKLTEETLEWLAPYEDGDIFIYENNSGNLDTLVVNRSSDTEYCGEDECGSNCEVEEVILSSLSNPDLNLILYAFLQKLIDIKSQKDEVIHSFIEFNPSKADWFLLNIDVSINLDENFEWNGAIISVLESNCDGGSSCDDYEMKSFIISKTKGLLKYTDKNNMEWTIVD